jgi:hypothetical protein
MNDDEREPHEEELITHIQQVMQRQLERDYVPGATRRDAHPKHTGLLKATFTVLPNLPPALRVGVFAEPRSYDAWIRTSSASAKVRSDAIPDVRGFAIKLLDVAGDKIAESDEPRTQDFVLLSMPSMPLGTVKLFHDAIYYSTEWSIALFAAKMLLTGRAAMLRQLNKAKITPTSPIEIRYWSTTPYQFGPDQVVKYSVLPTSGAPTALPKTMGDTYLTDAMERRLAGDTVTYDFAVQLRKTGMAINDSAPRWDETESPFIKVANLVIPPQAFRTEERNQLAEGLSFSPAHARVEHRPIGSINRARMRVYRANSDFRHARRGLAKTNAG